MKNQQRILIATGLAVAILGAGCGGMTGGPKQTAGTLLGGVGGGLLGSQVGKGRGQIAGVIAGTLIGGYLGSTIGKGLDDTDRLMANRTAQQSFENAPDGQVSSWKNPNSGNSGTTVITRTAAKTNSAPCREYTTTVMIGGKREQAYGKACRQKDGAWKIISEDQS